MQQGEIQEYVVFSPTAQVLTRPGGYIQFGVDATTVGMVELNNNIQAALQTAYQLGSRPIMRRRFERLLIQAGMHRTEAHLLVDDLLRHGVLRNYRPKPQVALIGDGTIRGVLQELLERAGLQVVEQSRLEDTIEFLRRLPSETIVVAFHFSHKSLRMAQQLSEQPWVIPCTFLDGRGIIGPIRAYNVGPCLVCAQLHRLHQDPHWQTVLDQQSVLEPVEVPTVYSTAAHIASLIQAINQPVLAQGAPRLHVYPGQIVSIVPGGSQQEEKIQTHHNCPVCQLRDEL